MDITYEMMPAYLRLLVSKKRYLVYFGGRGGGKTTQVAISLVIKILTERRRGLHYVCLRETQASLKDSSKAVIMEAIELLGVSNHFYTAMTSDTIHCLDNDCFFNFKGLGTMKDVTNFKSINGVVIAWIDEAETVKRDIWEVFKPSVRVPDSQIIITFNPKKRTDVVYEDFVLNPPSRNISEIYKINYTDNVYFHKNAALMIEKEDTLERFPDRFKHIWLGATSAGSGQILNPKWWRRYDSLQAAINVCTGMFIVADTACKVKTYNDYSVLQCWGYNAHEAYLLDQKRAKWEFPDLIENTKQFVAKWCTMGNRISPSHVYIEDKVSGTSLGQTLHRQYLNIRLWKPKDYSFPEDKVGRAMEASFLMSGGCFFIPSDKTAEWAKGFVNECSDFEADSEGFDDQVDAFTMAASICRWLRISAIGS